MRSIKMAFSVVSTLVLACTLACGGGGSGDFAGGNGDFAGGGGGGDDFGGGGGGGDDFGGGGGGGGGGDDDLGGGGGGGGDDTGDSCQANSDCNEGCLVVTDENGTESDFGYCTKRCESFADCPAFWDCEEIGNAAGTHCVQ